MFLLNNICVQTSVILLTLCIAHPAIAHETSANTKKAVVQNIWLLDNTVLKGIFTLRWESLFKEFP